MGTKCKNIEVTTPDGVKHASKKEAKRWVELKLLERAGEIKDLDRQVVFELIPKQTMKVKRYGTNGQPLKDGEKVIERGVDYIADFVYVDNRTGEKVVEDVKGFRDPSSAVYAKFVIKRKLMLWIHGIKIREV